MQEEVKQNDTQTLDGGTYEIIRGRLDKQKQELQKRINLLNDSRKEVFGSLETKLIANNRISTENNCIARDIVTIDEVCIFGYNVHFGLRTEITLKDVFSIYTYKEQQFEQVSLDLINDETFKTDFTNLYKYYRNTIFAKFALIGNYLYMVFQLSESVTDIKTFKWLVNEGKLTYIDNRSDHEYKFPSQHEFKWQEAGRDNQRYGEHSHISILDKVFVETIGGDLTIKIEDNTNDGQGIYSELVEYKDQTLDDGQFRYGDLGNLIPLEIKPFQEKPRYFVYNHKIKEVQKIDSIKEAVILLPDEQGIIFPNGYYLQTGEYKVFETDTNDLKFQKRIASPNGEDYMFVFYGASAGSYLLMQYNVIEQTVQTPIICNGYTVRPNGELCYFKNEDEQTKHHMVQIWQTPFLKGDIMPSQYQDTFLYKIGNKDIVRAMAESQELINLLSKEDSYSGLYTDIAKLSKNILDSYYWLHETETHQVDVPVKAINQAANSAIDEFQKVLQLKRNATKATKEFQEQAEQVFGKVKSTSFKSIDDFVKLLNQLRTLRGEAIGLYEVRYVDKELIGTIEEEIAEYTRKISERCVQFLLNDKALAPYQQRVVEKEQALEQITKVIDAKKLEDEVNQIAKDLEMLIEIVSNLAIEDTSHSTKIIDNISLIFATLNQLKAAIKNKRKSLGSKEAQADFAAQLKLIDQSIINYLDIADTIEKCDDFQTKIAIQLEELEGKFADFEEFITTIIEKREEVYNAFQARKSVITEKRNKRSLALENAAVRILKGVDKRAGSFGSATEINGYFASDLMINKLRDIVVQLKELEDIGKAEEIETKLKTAREDALRKLKDKLDLYEDGDNVIKFGKHKFGVNKQTLDLSIVYKSNKLQYHLAGTDFYEDVTHPVLLNSRDLWDQEYVSENDNVYRSAYLAYKIFNAKAIVKLSVLTFEELLTLVQEESSSNYAEGYVKGVHDYDAALLLQNLVRLYTDLGLLRYPPEIRAAAQFFWNSLSDDNKLKYNDALKASGEVLQVFPESKEYDFLLQDLEKYCKTFGESSGLYEESLCAEIAAYLFAELQQDDKFQVSTQAMEIKTDFLKTLQQKNAYGKFTAGYEKLASFEAQVRLIRQWVISFIKSKQESYDVRYADEVVCSLLFAQQLHTESVSASATVAIDGLKGDHKTITNGVFALNYYDFVSRLVAYINEVVPAFIAFKQAKHDVTEQLKEELKLQEMKPRVLTSFVRNQLIDQVYLPLFGDNLSKQLGTVGDTKRTDRMGMLLLISPPGYGKTTLMEYMANRLGLVFMKINGPAIGHEVTSVDPEAATNSAAREELKRLNLAFEMGNNVMLYLDDIQHCNPEFLQKFISLSDGTRRIEGIYKGKPKTYDLRGKKFCVIMAGNPYTESGEKFRIPDMLANRADIYNLGDIIGVTAKLFNLSLIENALTSNPVLHQLSTKHFDDVYKLIEGIENNSEEFQLEGNHTTQEIADYKAVLQKILTIRNTVLKVNETYIKSAAMEDAYRTEPAFKLQGSYRDMNKLVSKVVPIMNDAELGTLLLSHYESESQTLTSAAEANLLKFKELGGLLTNEEATRWQTIKETFVKNNKLKGLGDTNEMAQVLTQMIAFSDNLEGIRKVLEQSLNK